jgi:hypothetical protein
MSSELAWEPAVHRIVVRMHVVAVSGCLQPAFVDHSPLSAHRHEGIHSKPSLQIMFAAAF